MANIKSAKKRILVNRTKADRNKAIKSGVKTAIKKVYTAIEANDKEAAAAALLNATSVIDKATSKGVYHKNYASRKVSSFIQGCKPDGLILEYRVNEKQPIPSCGLFFITFLLFLFFMSANRLILFIHPVNPLCQSIFTERKHF